MTKNPEQYPSGKYTPAWLVMSNSFLLGSFGPRLPIPLAHSRNTSFIV